MVQSLIPAHASWQRWASLSDYLPLLAEGCPDVFLDAVEREPVCIGLKALLQLSKAKRVACLVVQVFLAAYCGHSKSLRWESSLTVAH